ncbi:DUF924 family protein [Crenobacter sp. SG2303]|uniref:DUF924 family protein n=1 Tax=Crenobacter oryzisoli TaxID=3056844 RepID=A0ABT7XRU9_9NEIS|nr:MULTISPECIES: DUF924 family protein [unclassified Crenobacter]MDN0076450.1 DUF924 family protein [Crenobacter sp. SG2303]MDN0081389.1 DUF924 family protein [Crenobacter sp. SG2305]
MAHNWQHEVLDFWFGGRDLNALSVPQDYWFAKNAAFDAELHRRFLGLWQSAHAGQLDDDVDSARGALALAIVLDQFPRNLFRGHADAFATDAAARRLVREAIANRWDVALPPVARWFFYLPLEHSEELADQEESLRRHASLPDDSPDHDSTLDYARRHHAIIARFGRFPHRNAALGRASTPEEQDFLTQPGSSF